MSAVGVVVVVAGEPSERLARLAAGLGAQRGAHLHVCVAAPADEVDAVAGAFVAGGAIDQVTVLANPGGARSAGLNRCLDALGTDLVCRVDARSRLPVDYVARCVGRLEADPTVGVVGGHQVPVALGPSRRARAIARVLADPLATGGAAYRDAAASGPVDTAYLGAFRRAELEHLGGWAEHLTANEDFDLSQRYRAAGLLVWLEAGLDVAYEPRDRVRSVAAQYASFGAAKVDYWRAGGGRPAPRQWVGLLVPAAAAACLLGLALLRPRLGAAALALVVVGLGVGERRRPPEPDAVVRLGAAVLCPLPAAAFSYGALRRALRGATPAERRDRARG